MTNEIKSESFKLYFEIPEITLTVGTSPESKGHVEKFTAANQLMQRLDVVGKNKLVLLAIAEAGVDLAEHHVDAINHYLWSCSGLRSFKRVARMGWKTKYGWTQLRESLSVPVKAFIFHT